MWTFVDGRGATLSLPRTPRRIAVVDLLATSTLWAAGIRPVAAALGADATDVCLTAVGLRPDDLVRLDTVADPTPDLTTLAELGVDLIVDRTHGTTPMLIDENAVSAPVLGLTLKAPHQSLESLFAEVETFARSLGSPGTDHAALGRYARARARVRAEAGGGRTVGFAFVRGDDLVLVDPARYPWLVTLRRLGVRVSPPWRGPWWDPPPVDLLFVHDDGRTPPPPVPAADLWDDRWHAFDHDVYAVLFDDLADRLSGADR